MKTKIKIPVILGPTASGKTALSLAIAREFGCEIISCDSRQVYKYMNIGTAKPTAGELAQAPHWMINLIAPDVRFSAWEYVHDVKEIIQTRSSAGKKLMICGGTGLYFQALSHGLGPQTPVDETLRASLLARLESGGARKIFDELAAVDPATAAQSHPNNVARNVRAMEVYLQTGIPLSRHKTATLAPDEYEFLVFVLDVPRDELYGRINSRVENMARMGLWEEFCGLRNMGFTKDSPGLRCVGYQELFDVEQDICDLPAALEKIKQNSRHYAKRQVTWFKHQTKGIVVDMKNDGQGEIFDRIRKFY